MRLYLKNTGVSGALGSYFTLRVNEGTGNAADCSDFASARGATAAATFTWEARNA